MQRGHPWCQSLDWAHSQPIVELEWRHERDAGGLEGTREGVSEGRLNENRAGGWKDGSGVRALTALLKVLSSNPHGGSQPSVMRSDALLWCV